MLWNVTSASCSQWPCVIECGKPLRKERDKSDKEVCLLPFRGCTAARFLSLSLFLASPPLDLLPHTRTIGDHLDHTGELSVPTRGLPFGLVATFSRPTLRKDLIRVVLFPDYVLAWSTFVRVVEK